MLPNLHQIRDSGLKLWGDHYKDLTWEWWPPNYTRRSGRLRWGQTSRAWEITGLNTDDRNVHITFLDQERAIQHIERAMQKWQQQRAPRYY